MNRRGQRTSLQERIEIVERAAVGHTDAAIATMLGCSQWTVRKWRRIGEQQGVASLTSGPGRPPVGLLGTIPACLRETIRRLREDHPGWGPDTILATLRADPRWDSPSLPARTQVAAFLKEAGLTRRYQRRSRLPQPQSVPADEPHVLWQLDAQGVTMVAGVGKVNLINGVDVVSRMKVESYPSVGTTNPPTEDYFLALRHAFLTYGLPERISLDHGTVFFDNTTTSPFPTRLHLWLVALGVDVSFIRPRRPTDHAIVERTHQTMARQALDGQSWTDQQALWAALDERREILNTHVPTHAFDGRTPLQAHPTARHSGRQYRPEWEKELLDIDRVYRYLAGCRWFRQIKPNGRIKIGGYQYYLGRRLAGAAVEVTFDHETGMLLCQPENKPIAVAVPIQGLTIAELMGEFAGIIRLPVYQLALPFSAIAHRQQSYAASFTGTN
jgi:transposase InsO family protein